MIGAEISDQQIKADTNVCFVCFTGVDVWAKAKNDMTAEDILKSIHSKLTQEALQIISGWCFCVIVQKCVSLTYYCVLYQPAMI